MTEVLREGYLKRLESGKDRTDVIKVITGMRRSGKTVLMKQFIRRIVESGVPESSIVYMNFESKEWEGIKTDSDLSQCISSRSIEGRMYVFLDEVQRVEGWENVVNALQVDADADIYITGSNAYLLSSELSTYISGRYVELKILPLSFREYMELHPGDRERRFMQYLRTGSLPIVDPDGDEMFEQDLLTGVFSTVLIKDVLKHTGTSDVSVLEDIARFLYSNVGNITSCNSIAQTLGIDNKQVRKYIKAMTEAFLIYKVGRYDIRGKKLMDSLEKYYVSDTGMRNAVLGISSREDISRLVENVVYLELLRRGYEVSVGKYGDTEVDFTARRLNDIEYYQVTLSMMSETTYGREVRPFELIKDNHPKTVLSMDGFLVDIPDGIRHRNVIDWLMERERSADRGRISIRGLRERAGSQVVLEPVVPVHPDADRRRQVGVVEDYGPLRVARGIVRILRLGHPFQCEPGVLGGRFPARRVDDLRRPVVTLLPVAVPPVLLVGQDLLLVHEEEVGHRLRGRHGHPAGLAVAVVLRHATVAGGIGDVEVVVPPAGGEHVVHLQQIHRFLRGGGPVQHQTDGQAGPDRGLSGILTGGLAVQRKHGDGDPLLVDPVQADERGGQAGDLRLHRRGVVGPDVVQGREGHGRVPVLRVASHQHRGCVVLEVIAATHDDIPVRQGHGERGAPELRSLDVRREMGDRLLRDRVHEALVVGYPATDHAVQVVTVPHAHRVQAEPVLVGRDLLYRTHRPDARTADEREDRQDRYDDHENSHQCQHRPVPLRHSDGF